MGKMKDEEFNRKLEGILKEFEKIDKKIRGSLQEEKAKQDLETNQSKFIQQDSNLNNPPKQYDSNLDIPEEKSLYRTSNI